MSSSRDPKSAEVSKMIQDFTLNPVKLDIPPTDDKKLLERLNILKEIVEDTHTTGLNLIKKHEKELKNQKKEENFIHNKATYSNLEYELKPIHEFYQKSLTDFYNALTPITALIMQKKKEAFEVASKDIRDEFTYNVAAINKKLNDLNLDTQAIDTINKQFKDNASLDIKNIEAINEALTKEIGRQEVLIRENMRVKTLEKAKVFNAVFTRLATQVKATTHQKSIAAMVNKLQLLNIAVEFDSDSIKKFKTQLNLIEETTEKARVLMAQHQLAIEMLEKPDTITNNLNVGAVKILGDYIGEAVKMNGVSFGDHLSTDKIETMQKYPAKLQAIIALYKKFIKNDDMNSINDNEFAEMVDGIIKDDDDLVARLVIHVCNNDRLAEMGLCLAICLNKDSAVSQNSVRQNQSDYFLTGLEFFLLNPDLANNQPFNSIILDYILAPATITRKVRDIRDNPLSNHENIQTMVVDNFTRTNKDNIELLRVLNVSKSPELEKIAAQVDAIMSHINSEIAKLAKNKPADHEKDIALLNSFKPKVLNILLSPKLTDEVKYIKITEAANAHFNQSHTVKRVLNRVMEAIENLLSSNSKRLVRTRLFSTTTQSSIENKVRDTLSNPPKGPNNRSGGG